MNATRRTVLQNAALVLLVGPASAQISLGSLKGLAGSGNDITSDLASGGLKQALERGIAAAVASTGRPGGYLENPLIKIGMPPKLEAVATGLRTIGMGSKVDEFVHSMNAAAEQAAPEAKAILMTALRQMTIADAKGVVTGGRTAGTDFFKRTTTTEIQSAFRPIVEKAMAKTGVTEQYQALMASAPKLPFARLPTLDVNQYVLDKSTDGLFTVMGQEETKIRTDPAAQVTPLLKTVFGKR
jgi:hypothetical protein